MGMESRETGWNVLRTRSRQEKIVEKHLEQKQITVYLPKISRINPTRMQQKPVEWPLFPGYVFIKPRADQFYSLNFIPGSCGLVLEKKMAGVVYDRELDAIRMLLGTDIPIDCHAGLLLGTRVKVMIGPLAGIEGELVNFKNQNRLVLNAKILGSAVSIEINRHQILPI